MVVPKVTHATRDTPGASGGAQVQETTPSLVGAGDMGDGAGRENTDISRTVRCAGAPGDPPPVHRAPGLGSRQRAGMTTFGLSERAKTVRLESAAGGSLGVAANRVGSEGPLHRESVLPVGLPSGIDQRSSLLPVLIIDRGIDEVWVEFQLPFTERKEVCRDEGVNSAEGMHQGERPLVKTSVKVPVLHEPEETTELPYPESVLELAVPVPDVGVQERMEELLIDEAIRCTKDLQVVLGTTASEKARREGVSEGKHNSQGSTEDQHQQLQEGNGLPEGLHVGRQELGPNAGNGIKYRCHNAPPSR